MFRLWSVTQHSMWSDPDIVELILEENDGKRNNMLQNPNLPSASKNCAEIKLWCLKNRASHFSPVFLQRTVFYFWVMTKTLTKQLQVKSRTGKQERQSCDWNSVQIYQSQRLFGQRLHSFSSHISSVPDPVVTSAFVIYFLSFVTFTGLAFQVCASPFVNNWWWSAACWESKAATGVWAAGTRWQLALTWHTNTHSHTYIWRYESHWLFPHSLPPSLSRLFLHHRK